MTHALFANLILQQGGGLGLPMLLFQIVAIGLVFYFLIIRPQGQARKKHAELLQNLKKGDEVMTVGGIVGVVKDIREVKDRNEWRVTIETGTAQVVVERSRIVRIGAETALGAAQA
ncbi:MAG TPA: preprotein translocase subunit YajC [Gemmatimonadales bacterium]|nr:preprotein translocase subunit YajC [Gemmatimonadales bacterium]